MTRQSYDPKTKIDLSVNYPDLYLTRERLRSLRTDLESISSLESLGLRVQELENLSKSLSNSFESFMSDLTRVSDRLEKKSQGSEDPEVWRETEDLINMLDHETRDLRESLSVFRSWVSDPMTDRTLSQLLSETADHFIMDSLTYNERDPESDS